MYLTTIQYRIPIPQQSTTVAAMVYSQMRRDAIDRTRAGLGPGERAHASFVSEDIANAADRVNQFLFKWIVYLAAQPPYYYFYYISARIKVHVPDLLYDFRP